MSETGDILSELEEQQRTQRATQDASRPPEVKIQPPDPLIELEEKSRKRIENTERNIDFSSSIGLLEEIDNLKRSVFDQRSQHGLIIKNFHLEKGEIEVGWQAKTVDLSKRKFSIRTRSKLETKLVQRGEDNVEQFTGGDYNTFSIKLNPLEKTVTVLGNNFNKVISQADIEQNPEAKLIPTTLAKAYLNSRHVT